MNFLTAVSRQMTRFTALIIVLASIVAFIEPATFSWVKGDTQVVVLGIIMLGMGMTLGKEDYQILAKRPLDIFIGAVAQYTIMPLLAIGIAKAFNLSPGVTLTMLPVPMAMVFSALALAPLPMAMALVPLEAAWKPTAVA